tara:strand:- start:315 stop:785 length:471 start_codon:yes stop_codon:yes gene_type:complete
MKAKMRRGTTTITHPIYGEVEWVDTNESGTRIQIKYYSARHGEHLREWIDWTIPKKDDDSGLGYLYGRKVAQVSFVFERVDGARLEVMGVEHDNIIPPTVVTFPSCDDFALIDVFFGHEDAGGEALYGYVEGWDSEVPIYGDDEGVLGCLKIKQAQ